MMLYGCREEQGWVRDGSNTLAAKVFDRARTHRAVAAGVAHAVSRPDAELAEGALLSLDNLRAKGAHQNPAIEDAGDATGTQASLACGRGEAAHSSPRATHRHARQADTEACSRCTTRRWRRSAGGRQADHAPSQQKCSCWRAELVGAFLGAPFQAVHVYSNPPAFYGGRARETGQWPWINSGVSSTRCAPVEARCDCSPRQLDRARCKTWGVSAKNCRSWQRTVDRVQHSPRAGERKAAAGEASAEPSEQAVRYTSALAVGYQSAPTPRQPLSARAGYSGNDQCAIFKEPRRRAISTLAVPWPALPPRTTARPALLI
jgi:hypothetical protein